ncbi:MAG: hypothetical protein C0394_11015 [Syntrophus sp. (in: bacteria)]|nr:hypothetical protein [Syntrophus sp. (in: bacteria)]
MPCMDIVVCTPASFHACGFQTMTLPREKINIDLSNLFMQCSHAPFGPERNQRLTTHTLC